MRVAMITTAAMLIASPALAYVDPAIALCELATREGRPEGAEIATMTSRIEGARVLVFYTVSILGTKPKQRENICQFQYDAALDRFVTAPILSSPPPDCHKRREEYSIWEQRFFNGPQPPSNEVTAAWKRADGRMEECTNPKLDNDFERTRADVLDRLWRETGIYPIAPADTALSAVHANLSAALRGASYDRAAAAYVTSSSNPTVLDYIICLEAEASKRPDDEIQSKLNAARDTCVASAARLPADVPAEDIYYQVLECGFRPGDASPDMGC